MDKFLPYFLLGLAFVAIGITSLAKGSKGKSRRSACVMGSIINVEEKLDIRTDKAGEARRYRYIPTFGYQVNGRSYTCGGVYAYDAKRRFQVGDTAQIWYDPRNPGDAAPQEAAKAKGKTGVVFILIGVALCVLAVTQLG